MKNLKERCIELLKENLSHIIKTDKDAEAVFIEINDIVSEDRLEEFIKQDLCGFSSRDNVLNWFLEEDVDLLKVFRELYVEITQDMVGMNLSDVIESSLLDDKENYIKVNDNIHLTYWM